MPVTAKLSKLFYDRLGEEIATELVNWFNDVDATYRADLRELNELNFARFDAKLEQRTAELDARVDQRTSELDAKIELRAAELRADIGRLEAKLEQRLAQFGADVQREIHGVETRLGSRIDRLEVTLERRLAEQTRWLFGAWAALLIPIIGLWLRR
jgi:hypothetical protein